MNNPKRTNGQSVRKVLIVSAASAGVLSLSLFFGGCSSALDKTTNIPKGRSPIVGGAAQFAQAGPGSLPSLAEEVWVIRRTR